VHVEPIQLIIDTPPWTPYPFPNPYPITWHELPPYNFDLPITCAVFIVPQCGESFHENGRIASRIACENGKQHGKSVYWDEKGRKYAFQFYSNGKLLMNKSYDTLGRLVESSSYDYKNRLNGEQLSVDYDHGIKTIDGYSKGSHTYHKEFENKILTLYETYKNDNVLTQTRYRSSGVPSEFIKYQGDYIVQNTQYYENGNLYSEQLSDSIGRPISEKTWDENGILTSDKRSVNGLIHGVFLESYNPTSDYKKVSQYVKGNPIKTEEYEKDRLIAEIFYWNGKHDYSVGWYPNGDTSFLFTSGRINHQKKWDETGKVVHDFFYNSSSQFVGKSFYTVKDTTYLIVAVPVENAQAYIMRWTVFDGDTVREDFMNNFISLIWNNTGSYLASNYYIKDTISGKYVQHGIWKYYSGNSISHTSTYSYGKRNGLAIFYDHSSIPKKLSEGHFYNNIRTGEWVSYSDSGNRYVTYELGKENGPFRYLYPNGSIKVSGTNLDGKAEGQYSVFHENGVLQQLSIYKNGKINCYRKTYDEQGRILNEGQIIDNTVSGKWFFYSYDDQGNVKRIKRNYPYVRSKKGVV
jgi:antitoxin component YwqK of YwqJK toxin-antitoxin module